MYLILTSLKIIEIIIIILLHYEHLRFQLFWLLVLLLIILIYIYGNLNIPADPKRKYFTYFYTYSLVITKYGKGY